MYINFTLFLSILMEHITSLLVIIFWLRGSEKLFWLKNKTIIGFSFCMIWRIRISYAARSWRVFKSTSADPPRSCRSPQFCRSYSARFFSNKRNYKHFSYAFRLQRMRHPFCCQSFIVFQITRLTQMCCQGYSSLKTS